MWICSGCGASVDNAFDACDSCGERKNGELSHVSSPTQRDALGNETTLVPNVDVMANVFVAQIEPPVASSLAIWVWIIAVFAFFPVLGVLPSLALAVCSAILLLKPAPMAWDRRIGTAGLVVAFLSLSITAFWGVMLVVSPPGDLIEAPEAVGNMGRDWTVTAIQIVVLVLSIILHECAHGVSALWCGDGTAARKGRLRLNPLVHVDLFGSLILPAILIGTGSSVLLGWAKPVPINQQQFRNRRRGLLAVTLAGVSINLLLALMCTAGLIAVGSALRLAYPEGTSTGFAAIFETTVTFQGVNNAVIWERILVTLKMGVLINLVLFSFNILPIPPLDGYGVLEALAPRSWMPMVTQLRAVGMLLLLGLVFTNALQYALLPGVIFGLLMNMMAGAMTGWG